MNRQETESLTRLLTTCKKAFPHSQADTETIALYVMMLNDMSIAEAKAAILKCMRTARFFPTVAEILEAAESVKQAASGTKKPDAGQAWQEAMNNVRKYGGYKAWKYSCPEVEAACNQFGQQELIYLESNAVNTARAQFMRIYNEILARGKDNAINNQVLKRLGTATEMLALKGA